MAESKLVFLRKSCSESCSAFWLEVLRKNPKMIIKIKAVRPPMTNLITLPGKREALATGWGRESAAIWSR